MKAYFFGCSNREKGHYLYDTNFSKVDDRKTSLPFKPSYLDGGFLQNILDVPGNARLFYIAGWTVLTFWDRSGDGRGNSNSSFVFNGIYNFDKMMQLALQIFPSIVNRFNFDIDWVETKLKCVKSNNWEIQKYE